MSVNKINILDDIAEIKKIDKNGMLDICIKISEHCKDAIQRTEQITLSRKTKISKMISIEYKKPKNVIISGMGGSSIGGEILRDWLRYKITIPIEVNQDYFLPTYANKDTLVFLVSYSGNTEETLSALVDAIKKGCMVITISSGGHLFEFSKKLSVPHISIPSGFPPRVAIPYLFFPLPIILEKMVMPLNIEEEASETISILEELNKKTSLQTLTANNPSKKLALELWGTIPVFYGLREYRAVARRLKTQFNENSKLPSKYDFFPEIKHNEVEGWETTDISKNFSIILLRDQEESPEIKNTIEATKMTLHKTSKILEIYSRGHNKLAKIFSLLHIGDLASIYLAILQKKDPMSVEKIERIKKRLEQKNNMVSRLKKEIEIMIRN